MDGLITVLSKKKVATGFSSPVAIKQPKELGGTVARSKILDKAFNPL